MRRLLAPVLVLALALPAAAAAHTVLAGDGTLAVRDGDGIVRLDLRGSVIGRIDHGRIWITNPEDNDCATPLIWNADIQAGYFVGELDSRRYVCRYTGSDMRFRFVGGDHVVSLNGRGISLSAVGRGTAYLQGSTLVERDGTYSIDGGDWRSLPDDGDRFTIGARSV